MTKLEEIARAIAFAAGDEWDWDDPEIMRGYWIDKALAAIEAMMTPSDGMLTAGVEYRLRTEITGDNKWRDDTKALFETMLRAALGEALFEDILRTILEEADRQKALVDSKTPNRMHDDENV